MRFKFNNLTNIAIPAPIATDERAVLSHTFRLLKWVLALTVVADHFLRSDAVTVGDELYIFGDNLNVGRLARFVVTFLKNYAVPVFFIMSAYLFHGVEDLTWTLYRDKLKRRLKTLVWPYFVWNTVGLFSSLIVAVAFLILGINTDAFNSFDFGDMSAWSVLTGYFYPGGSYYPYDVPLWYVRDLLILILFTPLLSRVIRLCGKPFIILLACVCLIGFDGFNHRYWVSLSFYCIGLYLAIFKVEFSRLDVRLLLLAVAFYLINGYLHFTCRYDFSATLKMVMKNVNILVGAYVALGGAYVLVKHYGWRGSTFLAGASFFIYLVHHPFKEAFKSMVFTAVHPATDNGCFFTLIFAYLLYIAVLTGIYWIITKIPRLPKLLFGR